MEHKGTIICLLLIALLLIICYGIFENEFKNSFLLPSDENGFYSGYKMCPYFMLSSIPFLVVTFIVYGYFSEIRNLHGKCLMSYVFSFAILYATSSIIELNNKDLLEQHTEICTVLGYLWMTAILCCCFWSNVMCYDIWVTFKSKVKIDSNMIFIRYCLYAFGIPVIIETIFFILNHFELVPEKYNNKIGVNSCKIFTSQAKELKAIYMFGPLAFCLIINIVIYTLTCVKIYKHNKVTVACHRRTSNRVFSKNNINFNDSSLYLRLAIVMGIHWIIEVSSNLIGDPRLYFVAFAFFNMQGPIVFVTFVCNSKFKYFLMKRFNKNNKFASRDDIRDDDADDANAQIFAYLGFL